MDPEQSEVTAWRNELAQQRQNLQLLRSQQNIYAAGEVRLSLLNQIMAAEEAIREAKANLRRLKIEPDRSTIDPKEVFERFPDFITKQYPHPIALACNTFNEETEATRRFIALDKLISHLIKYLTGIFIGQARRDCPPEYPLPGRLEWLAIPTLEAWAEALGELSQLYRQPSWREKWRLDGLFEAVTRPLLGKESLVEAIDYLTIKTNRVGLDEPSVIDFLQLLAWYCGLEWEDAPGQYPVESAEPLMLRLQPALATVLTELEPLRQYPLVYLEWADTVETQVRLRPTKFMGQKTTDLAPFPKPALTAKLDQLPRIKSNRVYIADKTGLPILSLHPIFVLHRWEMYQLKAHRPSNYLEFLSCVRGTKFLPPPEASVYFTNWSQSEVDPIAVEVEEIPPLLGENEERIQQVDPIPSELQGEPLPLTWLNVEGRQALEFALGESLRIGRFWVGVEFLLMGFSRQTNGIFFRLLGEIGLDPGDMRGVWRGLAGVVESERENWRNRSVGEIGQEALPRLRQVDPEQLRRLVAGEQPEPVITPRLMAILQDAVKLADGSQAGQAQLLKTIFRHQSSIAVQLFFSAAYQAGWSPKQVLQRLDQLVGLPPEELANLAPQIPQPPRRRPDHTDVLPLRPRGGSVLAQWGRDLTQAAQEGRLHPAAGETARQAIAQMGRILLQREANNPILVGDPGVGKTAVVEGFAWRLLDQKRPVVPQLAGRQIIELTANALTSGTKYRGDLEERLQKLLAEVKATKGQTIVFIDEIHNILKGGSNEAIAEAFKPALARGEFPCIGATTVAEYRQHIEKDAALARRFTPIWLEEPTLEEATEIVWTIATGRLAEHHQVSFAPAAIEAAVRLSARYLHEERLPGKAIKVLDEAASGLIVPGTLFGGLTDDQTGVTGVVSVEAVLEVISARTHIPLTQLGKTDKQRLLELESRLKARIIGQDEAIAQVARVVKRAGAGLSDPRRPLGVFLFAGPTGVGKTELALALTEALFDQEETIFRLDMSEFMEKHQVARLTGAPPGYVGHETEGQLTGHLRRHPYSVVLLDEMEKAHDDVQHLFLQLFDTGRLTDSQGRLADGCKAIFIMTTNLGAKEALGFAEITKSYQEKLLVAIHQHFTLEFINRIDRIVYFNPLTEAALLQIFDLEFKPFQQRLQTERDLTVTIAPEVKQQVVQTMAQQKLGARPLRRFIEDKLIAVVVDKLLTGEYRPGMRIILGQTDDLDLSQLSSTPPAPVRSPLSTDPRKFVMGGVSQASILPLKPQRPATSEAGLPHLKDIDNEAQAAFDERFLVLARRLAEQDITLEIDQLAKFFMCAPNAADQKPRQGRSVEQAFDELIEQPLTERLLAEEFKAGDWIKLDYSPDGPVIKKMEAS